jgi:hypothetical protein
MLTTLSEPGDFTIQHPAKVGRVGRLYGYGIQQ